MHIKRKTIPNSWPVPKTGTKYLAVPSHSRHEAVSLIMAMRDMLKFVKNKKEIKKILNEKALAVNGRKVSDMHYPVVLFDTLSILPVKKHYRLVLANKRFVFEEISEKESKIRIYKVIGKKILGGKKVQLNLNEGKNLLSPEKIEVGDFVEVDNAANRIQKIIPLKKDVEVVAIKGKHIGKRGKIKEIAQVGGDFVAKVACKDGEINANIKNLFVVE